MADIWLSQKHADSSNPLLRLVFGSLNCSCAPSFKWEVDETWRDVKSGSFYQPRSEAQNKPFLCGEGFLSRLYCKPKASIRRFCFNSDLIKHFLKIQLYHFWWNKKATLNKKTLIFFCRNVSAEPVRIRSPMPLVLWTFCKHRDASWVILVDMATSQGLIQTRNPTRLSNLLDPRANFLIDFGICTLVCFCSSFPSAHVWLSGWR